MPKYSEHFFKWEFLSLYNDRYYYGRDRLNQKTLKCVCEISQHYINRWRRVQISPPETFELITSFRMAEVNLTDFLWLQLWTVNQRKIRWIQHQRVLPPTADDKKKYDAVKNSIWITSCWKTQCHLWKSTTPDVNKMVRVLNYSSHLFTN